MASKLCFKLCTFDVTNTLLKFRMPVGEQYAKVGKQYGVHCDPNRISESFSNQWKAMNERYPNFGCSDGITSYLWWKMLVRSTFNSSNESVTESQIHAISGHLYELYKTNACWEVSPGVRTLLQRLKREKILLGIISNFDERLESVLDATDLSSYFDFVLASYVEKAAKPCKEIFDLALKKAQGVNAPEALHVGDDVALDYRAAVDAGWRAVLIDETSKIDPHQKVDLNCVVNSIVDLEYLIFSKFFKRSSV